VANASICRRNPALENLVALESALKVSVAEQTPPCSIPHRLLGIPMTDLAVMVTRGVGGHALTACCNETGGT
jgi:hypothetical protein